MSDPGPGELWIDSEGDKVFFFTYYGDGKLHYIYDDGSGSLDDYPHRYEVDSKSYAGWVRSSGE